MISWSYLIHIRDRKSEKSLKNLELGFGGLHNVRNSAFLESFMTRYSKQSNVPRGTFLKVIES